ncbi:VanZ family protein [uncultured Eubacterium sp.]|uniref:VanZ family protein n=1 Tax=uncultured Eubacterium sp. TaxID=165185 RepID=UPI003265E08C
MKNPILAFLCAVKDIIFDISVVAIEVWFVELVIIYIYLKFRKVKYHKSKIKETLFLIMFAAYIAVLLSATLVKRNYVDNPLGKVWEGWSIVKIGHSKPYWNFDPLLNIFLLSPLTFFLFHFKRQKKSKLDMCIYALKLGICASLFIECSQVLFHRGTFQIADIIYNSLGALIGIGRYLVRDEEFIDYDL